MWNLWIRAHHSLAFLILKFLFKADLDRDPFLKKSGVGPVLSKSRIWLLVEVISVFPWILLRFYLPRLLGYVVVCERYVLDTIVSLAYTYDDASIINKFPINLLFRFIPSDRVLLHLTGDTSCLKKRSKEGDIVKSSIEFQRKVYGSLAYSLKAKTINTSVLDVKETFAKILEHISSEEPRIQAQQSHSVSGITMNSQIPA